MNQSITNISVDVLKVHPRNTEFFDDISGEEYERFKKSIDEDGLLSPLVVAPDMTVISGHQRLKACKELGHKSVPVIINESLEDEDEKLKTLIAANFGRLKNDPIKQAKLIVEYEKLNGIKRGRPEKSGHNVRISQEDIAKEFGVDVRTIRRIKELSALLPEFQDIISSGCITATTGYKVLAKLSEEDQQKLLEQLPVSQKLTQKQVQEYVDRIQELENINAGYKMKLESKEKEVDQPPDQPADMAQLLDEKQALEAEKRQWYEKAQSYKKEVEESKTALDKVKAARPQETIVEVKVEPTDYQKIKDDLAITKEELRRANFVLSNRDTDPQIATRFGVVELMQLVRDFSNAISIFQFSDDNYANASSLEISEIKGVITEVQNELNTILLKMKGNVA